MSERVEDPALQERYNAHALEENDHLTVAERLTVASAKRTFSFDYAGVEIDAFIPLGVELDEIVKLYSATSDPNIDKETAEETVERLPKILSALILDESVTPEFLKSGAFGYSLYPAFVRAAAEAEAKELNKVESFRKK